MDDIHVRPNADADEHLDAAVMETFPASDPVSSGKPSETAWERQQRLKNRSERLACRPGYDIARALRKRYDGAKPLLIAVTAWAKAADRLMARDVLLGPLKEAARPERRYDADCTEIRLGDLAEPSRRRPRISVAGNCPYDGYGHDNRGDGRFQALEFGGFHRLPHLFYLTGAQLLRDRRWDAPLGLPQRMQTLRNGPLFPGRGRRRLYGHLQHDHCRRTALSSNSHAKADQPRHAVFESLADGARLGHVLDQDHRAHEAVIEAAQRRSPRRSTSFVDPSKQRIEVDSLCALTPSCSALASGPLSCRIILPALVPPAQNLSVGIVRCRLDGFEASAKPPP